MITAYSAHQTVHFSGGSKAFQSKTVLIRKTNIFEIPIFTSIKYKNVATYDDICYINYCFYNLYCKESYLVSFELKTEWKLMYINFEF